jgi:hypothetical protein
MPTFNQRLGDTVSLSLSKTDYNAAYCIVIPTNGRNLFGVSKKILRVAQNDKVMESAWWKSRFDRLSMTRTVLLQSREAAS